MNPVNPFEFHATERTEDIVKTNKYLGKVKIKALFQSKLTKISDSKIEVEKIGSGVIGIGYLFINPLALVQDPKLTLNLALAHEIGHIITKVSGFIEGEDYKEHGEEWASVVSELGYSESALPTLVSENFDFTANKLLKGYVPWGCNCHRSFKTVFNTTASLEKYVNGVEVCEYCQEPLIRIKSDLYPSRVKREIDFLKKLDDLRSF
jgi:predicted SprT family Zn-dependent metalloprotease